MKPADLRGMTTAALVDLFASIALSQDDALLDGQIGKVNRLFDQLRLVDAELKSRDGDQRSALVDLYRHPNAQVRVKAAKATLAVAPSQAHRMLKLVAESGEYPQSLEAGMSIIALERGIFHPE